jgi:hypothetical protein
MTARAFWEAGHRVFGLHGITKEALQEVVWVFLATSERWEHACEHLEPQIFLIA